MFNIEFKSLASSSAGNAYILKGYNTKILIECGLPFNKLINKLDGRFTDLDGCIVSHEHGDHCKCPSDIAKRGIKVYGIEKTFEKHGTHDNFIYHTVDKLSDGKVPVFYKAFEIGEFLIKPLYVDHGDVESCGYLIKSNLSGEKLLFIIDTFYCPYQLKGITHYVIEANYSEAILKQNQDSAKVYIDRLWGSHFSIERLCEFFKKQKNIGELNANAKIWLTHGSAGNSDPEMFKKMIINTTGIDPVVCKP